LVATLRRFEESQASGQLARLLRSGERFAAKAMVLSAGDDATLRIGVRPHRAGVGVRAAVGADRLPGGDRGVGVLRLSKLSS
jgi:hypothetical protein